MKKYEIMKKDLWMRMNARIVISPFMIRMRYYATFAETALSVRGAGC